MKNRRTPMYYMACGIFAFGLFIGFWGSLTVWFSWIVAPIFGAASRRVLNWKLVFSAAYGIFFGGLIMWFIISTTFSVYTILLPTLPYWSTVLLQIMTTAMVFLLGACIHDLIKLVKKLPLNRNTPPNDPGPSAKIINRNCKGWTKNNYQRHDPMVLVLP